MIWPWQKPEDPFENAPKWARALRDQLSTLNRGLVAFQKENKELIMSTQNQFEAALVEQTTQLETVIGDLKTAVLAEVQDAAKFITDTLNREVIKPATVTAVTGRLKIMVDAIATLTATTKTADDAVKNADNPPPPPPPPPTPVTATLRNVSRPGMPFQVGDSFSLDIQGAPNSPASLSGTQNGVSKGETPLGSTDGTGNLSNTGTLDDSSVGSWTEVVTVGGVSSEQIGFDVTAAPQQ